MRANQKEDVRKSGAVHLVELPARTGTLDASFRTQLECAIELETLRLDELVNVRAIPAVVPSGATVADVQRAAAQSGHMRILLGNPAGDVPGVVHVRDTLLEAHDALAVPLEGPALVLAGVTPVYETIARMRATSQQLAIVVDDGRFRGVVTLSDVLPRVLPQADENVTADIG